LICIAYQQKIKKELTFFLPFSPSFIPSPFFDTSLNLFTFGSTFTMKLVKQQLDKPVKATWTNERTSTQLKIQTPDPLSLLLDNNVACSSLDLWHLHPTFLKNTLPKMPCYGNQFKTKPSIGIHLKIKLPSVWK
jgi:hypothetical protein